MAQIQLELVGYIVPPELAALEASMGEELYADFLSHRKDVALKTAKDKAVAHANVIIGEGGSQHEAWEKLNAQLDAIWDKAYAAGCKAHGLREKAKVKGGNGS